MEQTIVQTSLQKDIFNGLSAKQKYIPSKYFYDDEGSRLFRKIMEMPGYYLTRAEYSIFEKHSSEIKDILKVWRKNFDIIEFGAGDGLKTSVLIKKLTESNLDFKYIPVDISGKALDMVSEKMMMEFSELKMTAMKGDYFDVLENLNYCNHCPKLILFLGSNIGNYSKSEAQNFFKSVAGKLNKADMVLTGFDLIKSPEVILPAYNDRDGITRDFNLNLLHRINRELGADFVVENFMHKPEYDSENEVARSFLVSKLEQEVFITQLNKCFLFRKNESIYTEMSQKFSLRNIENFAKSAGFSLVKNFLDVNKYFADSLWIKE